MTHSEMVKRRVADALKQYKAKNDIAQDVLAARLGVHQTAISAYIQEKTMPKADTLLRMAHVIELDLGELIPTEDIAEPTQLTPEPA